MIICEYISRKRGFCDYTHSRAFAGVGGFRLGLDGYHDAAHPEFDMKPAGDFKTVWAISGNPMGKSRSSLLGGATKKDSAREVALMKISPLCYKKSRTVSGRFLSSTCWLAVFRVRIIQWRSLLPAQLLT